jgi:hypothetical protein
VFDEILFDMNDRKVKAEKHNNRPYSPPELTEVTPKQAEEIVKARTNFSDSEAKKIVESLLREPDELREKAS